ncbi:Rho GTPase-activating protein 8, partial [Tetrabaena socialis]
YLVFKLDQLADEPYSVVWFHTRSTYWQNCPSLAWLWRTYERLPSKYRTNLHRLFVVHCDMPLWVGLAALGPLFSEALWRKVEWISRVEFLWDHIGKKQLAVPDFVAEHDSVLEDQPLMDYGVVATKEVNSLPGMPAPI